MENALLSQIKTLLSDWSKKSEFFFSIKPSDWEKQSRKIWDCEEGYQLIPYYYSVAISYILENTGKPEAFSSCKDKWNWVSGLLALIPTVNWDAYMFRGVVSSFQSKTKNESEVNNRLSNAYCVYCKYFFDEGLTLMESSSDHSADCLAGLIMNDFDRTCQLFAPEKDNELFAQAFIRTEGLDNSTICKAYDLATAFKPFNGSVSLAFFLKALMGLDEERKGDCEKRIKTLLYTKSSSMMMVLCNWLYRQDKPSSCIEDFILLALAHLEHPSEDIKRLDNVLFLCLIREELFEKIVILVSEQYGPREILSFENCLHKLHDDNDSFVNLVLSFVLHPKGDYRMVGRKLWDEYNLESTSFDPLSLSEEKQVLFVVFMLQDLGNPESRLPKVLPLFQSPSKRVRQALLVQMIPYVDNYMGHVTQAIDKFGVNTNETRRLKKYVDERAEYIKKRRELKELSPLFSQYRCFLEACRIENESQRQHVKEIEEKSTPPWMKMMKKEVLARGGGWRLENGKTQHLSPIQVSVPSRLMVQAMTPLELDNWVSDVIKDWDVTEGNH